MPELLSLKPTSLSSRRWAALRTRDPSANSAFFYGVTSTLIFCRPTCPARLARRSNIVYFDTISAARTAGYRPCKRCDPCNASWHRETRSWNDLIQAQTLIAIATVERKDWNVVDVAAKVGVSPGHLYRLFRKYASTTPKEFAKASVPGDLPEHCHQDEIVAPSEILNLPSIEQEVVVPQSTPDWLVWLPWDTWPSDLEYYAPTEALSVFESADRSTWSALAEQFVELDGESFFNAIPDQVFFTT